MCIRDRYLDYETRQERIDVLDEASRSTFDAFIHAGRLQPTRVAEVLAPAVAEGRIVASSSDPEEASFIERLGLSGAFPTADGGDLFGLVTQNAGNNKIDAYLHRSVEYRASFDPNSGDVEASVSVTLRNDAPDAGLPDYVIANRESSGQPDGTNWTWFNFYSPHELVSMSVGGEPVAVGAKRELGVNVYQTYLAVPSKSEVQISLYLKGTIDRDDQYRVAWYQQPLSYPDEVQVYVSVPSPWYVDDPDAPAGTVPLISSEPVAAVTSREDGHVVVPLREVRR